MPIKVLGKIPSGKDILNAFAGAFDDPAKLIEIKTEKYGTLRLQIRLLERTRVDHFLIEGCADGYDKDGSRTYFPTPFKAEIDVAADAAVFNWVKFQPSPLSEFVNA